jgi:hypothetical protein
MAADSTLVAAARYYGQTKAAADVPDMSKLYAGQREITKTYLTGITDVFTNMKKERDALKAAQAAQLKKFKTTAAASKKHIIDQEQSQPMKIHDAIYDKFKALEEEFLLYNTTGDNDTDENEKMRANLYAQLQMITNQAVESRGTIATTATMADDIVMYKGFTTEELAVATAIMGVDGNYDNIELSFNEKGQMVYHVLLDGMAEPVSWTIADFNSKVITHNKGNDVYKAKSQNEIYNMALTTDKSWEADDIASHKYNYLEATVNGNEKNFIDEANSPMNGRKSWVDSLYDGDNYDIALAAVSHLFTESYAAGNIVLVDVTGDGIVNLDDLNRMTGEDKKITEADLVNLTPAEKKAWQINIESMIDALVNPGHDAFDQTRSESLLGDYFIEGQGKEFLEGRNQRIKNANTGTKLTQTQIEDINKRNNINALVAKENISISDIEKIQLEGGVYVEQEGNLIHFRKLKTYKDEDVETTLKTVNIKDKDGLRTALWNYSRLSETYRSGPEYDKFDYQAEEQTPPYLFQTIPSGEQVSR